MTLPIAARRYVRIVRQSYQISLRNVHYTIETFVLIGSPPAAYKLSVQILSAFECAERWIWVDWDYERVPLGTFALVYPFVCKRRCKLKRICYYEGLIGAEVDDWGGS